MRNSHRIALAAVAIAGLAVPAVLATRFGFPNGGSRGDEATSAPGFEERASASAAAPFTPRPGGATGAVPEVDPTAGAWGRYADLSTRDALGPDIDAPELSESDSEDDRARGDPVGRGRELRLDRPGGSAPSVRFRGFDPEAPRRLVLWRLRDGRAVLIARGASHPDGSFEFPPLLVPAAGLVVVAAPVHATPDHPEASRVQTLPPRPPEAPRGFVSTAGAEIQLRVVPAEAAGFVLVAEADGRVLGRFALSALPGGAQRNLDLAISLPRQEDAGALQVAHERPDGLRSPWRVVHLNSTLEIHSEGDSHAVE